VLPLQPQSKKPAGGWKRYQSIHATPEECAKWDYACLYNIGIATGTVSDCFVLDIDGKQGEQTLAELISRHGGLPNTPTAKTGKGFHYYFRYPRYYLVRNLAGKDVKGNPMPGIDLRGDGGYVVAPPSIHPSGAEYEWLVSPWDAPLAEAPLWLIDLVAIDDDPDDTENYTDLYEDPPEYNPPPRPASYLETALAGELATLRAARKGHRNDALNKAAFSLGQLISAGLDEHKIINELTRGAHSIGLVDSEIAVTIQSGLAAGNANPRRTDKQVVASVADIRTQPLGTVASEHMLFALNVIKAFGTQNLVHAMTRMWHWDDSGVWIRIDEREVKKVIHRVASAHPKLSKNFIASILDITKTEINIRDSAFDRYDDMVINCRSGEMHLTNGKWLLRPARRESYMTVQLPVTYDANAAAPRFRQFLKEIFAHDNDGQEKSQAVLEMMGYSMLRSCAFERFIILIGAGANGKSVLLKVLTALIGQSNVSAVCPSQFDNRFQRAHMHGKLANIISELSENGELADATLKAVVSGEIIAAEHKFQPPFDFRPYCTCWFGTNHMPQTRDFSDAIYRRAIILTFNHKFEGSACDPNLSNKLLSELPGIFNMALDAIAGVIARKSFTDPPSSIEAKKNWRMESDQVAQFLEECCELYKDYESSSHDIYARYQQWAKEAGSLRPLNRKNFSGRLKRFGVDTHKGTGGRRMLHGIRLAIHYAGGEA
jgi:putative DNA primase/helicase